MTRFTPVGHARDLAVTTLRRRAEAPIVLTALLPGSADAFVPVTGLSSVFPQG